MIGSVLEYIERNRQGFLERLFELLRVRSISTDPACQGEMRRAAQWVHDFFAGCGIHSEIVDTARHPCVVADTGAVEGRAPTVLIYGHYDVQPEGDAALWHSPAFEPTLRNGTIYARGAADDKGQVLAHLFAAEAWKKVAGQLPVRVKFLIEGEEEIGSPNLAPVVRQHKDRLACDYVALSDTPKLDAATPAITFGTKGLIYKEIVVTGPKQDLHSGSYGGTVTNPANSLAGILAALRDAENRVTIPGFYERVRPLTEEEREAMASLPFDEEAYRQVTGSPSLHGEAGFTTVQRRWARPTLDVNGLLSGFTGEGAATIIPARAMAKVSMRIVPDQDPQRISAAFDETVRNVAPPGVQVEVRTLAVAAPYVCPLGSPGMKAAAAALTAGFGRAPVYIREGGTLPILPLFREVLGADSLMVGFCVPDCNLHGPNEFLAVSDFVNGIKTAACLMHELARL